MTGANLGEADLSGANLSGANLNEVNLTWANLSKTKHNNSTIWPDGYEPPPLLSVPEPATIALKTNKRSQTMIKTIEIKIDTETGRLIIPTDKSILLSLLDVWKFLPQEERIAIGENKLHKIKERQKARYVIDNILPRKWHKYYATHYSFNDDDSYGCFAGLVCNSCDLWLRFEHGENCAVGDIMGDFDYTAAYEFSKRIKAMELPPRGEAQASGGVNDD